MTETTSAARVARAINTLAAFCGPRDVSALTPVALRDERGWSSADVLILFGGSILAGAETMADAIRNEVATTTMLVGGHGHTTETLRRVVADRLPLAGAVDAGSEAEIFETYLREVHGLSVDLLERESTNCGNNISFALRLLEQANVPHERMILIQDATMQRRMSAGLKKARPKADVIDFASSAVRVEAADDLLRYVDPPDSMWPIGRFASLLMGEVDRLRDDQRGYGPRGSGWIAHVDVPPDVEVAYQVLARSGEFSARTADPLA